MATVATSSPQIKNAPLASLLSLVIPGAGQAYLGNTPLGLGIFGVTLFLAYIISWALDTAKIGLVTIGGVATSWLWLILAAFWFWNVLNAYGQANGKPTYNLMGFLLPALIIYIVAWQVTNVNLVRIITGIPDAQKIGADLIQPDLLTRDEATGSIRPSDNFGDLIGKVGPQDAPTLFVQLGLVPAGAQITWFTPGTVFVTIAQGLIATFLSIFLAVPLSFLAAHNIVGSLRWPWASVMNALAALIAGVIVFIAVLGLSPGPLEIMPLLLALILGIAAIVLVGRLLGFLFSHIQGEASRWLNALISLVVVAVVLYAVSTVICAWLSGILDITAPPGYESILPILAALPLGLGVLGAILGVYASLRLGDRPILFGGPIYYFSRAFFNIMRSIDTLIWGLIVIIWVGQGAMAGAIALGIHSIAALAKLYSEEIEHIDPGPVEAVTASGGNLLQQISYAVVPQIIPPFLAYTLLRWDINMRAATVVGFVAGGGIGFFVVETIRKGAYTQYAAALWVIAVVIIAVDYISARWREQILLGDTRVEVAPPKPFYRSPRAIAYIILGIVTFYICWNLSEMNLGEMLAPGSNFGSVVRDFLKFDLSPSIVQAVVKQLLITTFQALLATTLGGLIAIPFSFLAARNLTGRSRLSLWIYYAARAILNVLRSIEALLYVAIFVFWVGVGAFAGMLALAITTFALIGKLFSEAIEDIDPGPVEAITATGATRLQSIMYGILPQIVPPFVSYSIYQWDINIRIATVIGFAGGGGIGLLFQTYAGTLQYHKAGAVILFIVIVVTLMDFASAKVRQRLI